MTDPALCPPAPPAMAASGPQLSVWPTAQRDARAQRTGRYLPAATAHPAKMLPAIAATAIARYTRPGDLVLDPICGIGTTLIEAVHLGRDAIGVEYEPRWAELAAAGVTRARRDGAAGTAQVIRADARQLPHAAPAAARGKVALVITSPPYGASLHGQVRAEPRPGGGGVAKYDNRYSHDPANLAHQGLDELLTGFTQILAGCAVLLRPGGTVVITARPWRHRGELTDLPSAVVAAGAAAGLEPAGRCAALLAGLRGDDDIVPRPSFFQLDNIRKGRARGEPWHLIVHEDVLIFRAPAFPVGSGKPKPAQREARHPGTLPPVAPTCADHEAGSRAA
jgi:modification methylase